MTDKKKRELKDGVISIFKRFNILDHTATIGGLRDDILRYIDSLQEEPVSKGLEEEIKRYLHKVYDRDTTVGDVARHFAKWQKEQMMTKSIEAVVSQVPCSNEIILYNPSSVDKYYLPQEMNKLGLNKGDKVKLVIIKED